MPLIKGKKPNTFRKKKVRTQETAILTGWQYNWLHKQNSSKKQKTNPTELNNTFPSHFSQLDKVFQLNSLLLCRSRRLLWPLHQNTLCELSILYTSQRKPPSCLPRVISLTAYPSVSSQITFQMNLPSPQAYYADKLTMQTNWSNTQVRVESFAVSYPLLYAAVPLHSYSTQH